jgi:hypothetical protein
MSNVIQFRPRDVAQDNPPDPELLSVSEISLLTAVDAAIRDLRDISKGCDASVYEQAVQCRQMLEQAFHTACQS